MFPAPAAVLSCFPVLRGLRFVSQPFDTVQWGLSSTWVLIGRTFFNLLYPVLPVTGSWNVRNAPLPFRN